MGKAKYIILIILACILSVFDAVASQKLPVEVTDSVTGEAVPFVAVYIQGTQQGAMADEAGYATLTINNPGSVLEFSAMGYSKKTVQTDPSMISLKIALSPSGVMLDEVVVRRHEHYTKKNNPAVKFMERIRTAGPLTDPLRNDYYNYTKHERISFGMNNVKFEEDTKNNDNKKGGKFDFLKEHIDTSEITGLPILPLSVKEKIVDVLYRRSPQSQKEYIRGIKQAGVDEITDLESMQTLLEDAFREIDLYKDDINILQNRFVSPLSKIAPDFYKFYLTDTVDVGGEKCIELSFAPRNPATFGFIGRLYVPANDSTMFVKRVRMNVPPSINLNFIDHLQITQEFIKAPDGSRLKMIDDFNIEISVIKGLQGCFARRTTAYGSHNFLPSPNAELLDRLGTVFTSPEAYSQTNEFWASERLMKVSENEDRIATLMQRLRGVPIFYYGEKLVKILVSGYIQTGKNSKFDIGPMNTLISGNSMEGARFRVGGITTANLSPHWFARGYVAYGITDQKFKYNAELEYSFNRKRYHSREFPVHSLRLTERYDVDQLGQHYMFTNADNIFLALKRQKNTLMTYRRETRLDYTLELANNFSIKASANAERQETSPFVKFTYSDGHSITHYNELLFSLQLRYAPGEKFYQTKSERIPINLDAPVIILTQTYAPAKLLGAPFTINKTELSIQKRFWFSAFGFADFIVKGGHIWSSSPFLNLLIPNANLSYTIQPESFALMSPMEFINDSFVSWDVTYWANGAIFNYIPYLKKLKLREVFAFRGWLGSLSDKNNPDKNPDLLLFPDNALALDMHGRPYMEISAGIDNLFKCLRIDYVWRLTYRSNIPGRDKSGLRIALHITF